MHVALLRGENFRLYRQLSVELDPRLNVFVGPNAAGKTTVLEALYVATRGRSFRTAELRKLAGVEASHWNLFLQVRGERGTSKLGAGWDAEGLRLRLDESLDTTIAEVLRQVPVQLIDPASHRLIDEGPSYRRSAVDWGVFHVEHRFLEVWRRYGRALRQRNAAIRAGGDARLIRAWDAEMAEAGEQVEQMRGVHLLEVQRRFSQICADLLDSVDARIEWFRGWAAGTSLAEALEAGADAHRSAGTTLQGPHRAELKIYWVDRRAKDHVSRGQQKMLVIALMLAQADVLMTHGVSPPVFLLDDFASELAPAFQASLLALLLRYPGQKCLTAFEVPAGLPSGSARVFHVERGTIRY